MNKVLDTQVNPEGGFTLETQNAPVPVYEVNVRRLFIIEAEERIANA